MHRSPVTSRITICLLGLLLLAPLAAAQWDYATLEPVTSGPDFDMLGRRALGIDDRGTLHAIYRRGVGEEQVLFYVSKPAGGSWSGPEVVGPAGTYPGTGWLDVRGETGEPYVVFHDDQTLKLGIRRSGGWEFHLLETPPEYGVGKPAMTIDSTGMAHIAMLASSKDPLMWQIAYGYWDGSSDFHFQVLEKSFVPHHGLFAQPDIVARPDGSVAIAHHHLSLASGQILVAVADNSRLGGSGWRTEMVDVPGVILYPESLEIGPDGALHLAFHTNIELGAEHHVQYAVRRDKRFEDAEEISGNYTGARPRLALDPDGNPHFVFEETLGAQCTGRLIHAFKAGKKWHQEVIVEGQAVTPSFVLDAAGNGNLLFERKIVLMEDHDVEYFGYAEP
jgi:hypothetical protein